MELRVHDLVRVDALSAADGRPAWVDAALLRAPWAVVRRAKAPPDRLALGVRGATRAERAAIELPLTALRERKTPEALADAAGAHARARAAVPACASLTVIAAAAERYGLAWGPAGSVGFEIASGIVTAHAESDCDIIVRADDVAYDALAAFAAAIGTAPARVDVSLEFAFGGVALDEYLAGGEVVVKTPAGPVMRRVA